MQKRKAFTLLEVLISIGLLGMIMSALFSTVSMLRASNEQLLGYLEKAKVTTLASKVLYLDILSSDGNLTLKHDEFSRLCIEETTNSLYGLTLAKVCWVVLKEKNTLVRVEGNDFKIPLKFENKVEVDTVLENLESFDVVHKKDKVIIAIKEKGKAPLSFLIQGIVKPKPPQRNKNKPKTRNGRYQRP